MNEDTIKKDVSLVLLRILMEKTSSNNPKTKKELLDLLAYEDLIIEEKQFYRVIDKIIHSGYKIVKVKGRYAKYYYEGKRMSNVDFEFVKHLISTSKELSDVDKNRLLKATYICLFDSYMYTLFSQTIQIQKSNLKVHVLSNFGKIMKSMKESLKIEFFERGNVNEKIIGVVEMIDPLDEYIIITVNAKKYRLIDMYNVNFLEIN